jgi:hypothetical protein
MSMRAGLHQRIDISVALIPRHRLRHPSSCSQHECGAALRPILCCSSPGRHCGTLSRPSASPVPANNGCPGPLAQSRRKQPKTRLVRAGSFGCKSGAIGESGLWCSRLAERVAARCQFGGSRSDQVMSCLQRVRHDFSLIAAIEQRRARKSAARDDRHRLEQSGGGPAQGVLAVTAL